MRLFMVRQIFLLFYHDKLLFNERSWIVILSRSSRSARIVGRSGQSSETFGAFEGPVGADTFCTGLFRGSGDGLFFAAEALFFSARAKKGSIVPSVDGDLWGTGDLGGGWAHGRRSSTPSSCIDVFVKLLRRFTLSCWCDARLFPTNNFISLNMKVITPSLQFIISF